MSPILFVLSVSGFITQQIYKFRVKNVHKNPDGWILVFNTLIIGFACQLISISITTHYFNFSFTEFFEPAVLSGKILFFHLILTLACSVFTGFIFSTNKLQNFKQYLRAEIEVPDNQLITSGLFISKLHLLINKRVLINLKSGKVYVGRLIELDFNEHNLYENRGIEIFPLKSGFRDENKMIKYTTIYIFPKNKKIVPKNIVIKLSEIESFTEYDSNLDAHFLIAKVMKGIKESMPKVDGIQNKDTSTPETK